MCLRDRAGEQARLCKRWANHDDGKEGHEFLLGSNLPVFSPPSSQPAAAQLCSMEFQAGGLKSAICRSPRVAQGKKRGNNGNQNEVLEA